MLCNCVVLLKNKGQIGIDTTLFYVELVIKLGTSRMLLAVIITRVLV
jgi:hypothetical protein